MALKSDPVIDFIQAQREFSTDNGLPQDIGVRPPIAPWLKERIGKGTLLEDDEEIIVEGQLNPSEVSPASDGEIIENFAYYLPFHFYRKSWGIYIHASGILRVALYLTKNQSEPNPDSIKMAFRLLLEHERFHFLTEYAASRTEIIRGESCYKEYFTDKKSAPHEEAVANAFAITQTRRKQSEKFIQAAMQWLRTMPEGYRDFERWLKPNLIEAKRKTSANMNHKVATMYAMMTSLPPAEFLFQVPRKTSIPTYLIIDTSIGWLRISKPFPNAFGMHVEVHTNDHEPPHIHIQSPPGSAARRYEWPIQWPIPKPLRGDRELSGAERKRLKEYLIVYESQIDKKVNSMTWK